MTVSSSQRTYVLIITVVFLGGYWLKFTFGHATFLQPCVKEKHGFPETNTVKGCIDLERDPKTGRFLPGNKLAKGNKGNTQSKYGNKNALKHGFFAKHQLAHFTPEGDLEIFTGKGFAYRVEPDYYFIDEQGRIRLHDKVSTLLEQLGVRLEIVDDIPEDVYNIQYRDGKKILEYTCVSGAYYYS